MKTRRPAAYTLIEVLIASGVVLFGLVSALAVLQRGLQSLDYARQLSAASHVMQAELEQLRLQNWAQLEELQQAGETRIEAAGAAGRFVCTRTIRTLQPDMKEIIIAATWRGADGREQSARLITRYGRHGLNDYLSTAH